MKKRKKKSGQTVTEYVLIIAAITLTSIYIYEIFREGFNKIWNRFLEEVVEYSNSEE